MQDTAKKYSAQIKQEQIKSLFNQSVYIFFGIITVMIVVTYYFWDRIDRNILLTWLYLNVALTVARIIYVYSFKRIKPQGNEIIKWGNIFAATSFISGLLWGSVSLFLVGHVEHESVALIAFILAGMTLGSLVPLSSYIPAYIGFIVPALSPLAVVMFTEPFDTFTLIGILVTAFIFVSIGYSFVLNRNISNTFMLRFENLDLLLNFERKKEEAEKANKDKSRFLTATSHDLRQPLHAMDLYLGALKNVLTTDEQRALLDKSQFSSHALSELLNALMDVSRLDSGNITVDKKAFDIDELLNDIYHSVLPQAEERGFKICIEAKSTHAFTDPILLSRIVRNLITNAIKHSEGENIILRAVENKSFVTISVIDDGKGIADTEFENIFSEFYQLNNPERDRSKGLGLGLAIVSRIAKQLNHDLNVTSTLQKGSVFSLQIPTASDAALVEQETLGFEDAELAGLFIIIIEDETNVREATRLLLRSWDCEVLVGDSIDAINAELEEVEYPIPDIIISDYRLRENKTGLDAISSLRQRFNSRVPAIVVTGDTADNIAVDICAEQCDLIYKPVRPDELKNSIITVTSDCAKTSD